MTVKQRAWQTYEPKCGKPVKIVVWKNKDYDVPGQEVTLHSKYMKSWNAVLSFLTVVLQPRFGAIRKLYHLGSRKLVLCLQDIKSNEKYVAVGSDKFKFKKNGYLTKEEKRSPRVTKSMSSSTKIEDHAASMENFMTYTKKKDRTVVYFMVSGRACQMPLKVVLIRSDFLDYNMILDYLSYRLDIAEGIHYLCNTKGKTVSKLNHLKHGQLYIAVPFLGRFIKLDYPRLFANLMRQPLLKVDKLKGGRKKKQKILELKESLEVTPEEPKEMSRINKGASTHVKENCIGSKCVDKECRLFKDSSKAGSISAAESTERKSTIQGSSFVQIIDTNWEAYRADFKEKIDDLVIDVNTVRELLNDLVDQSITMANSRGIVLADVPSDAFRDQDTSDNNMTTFADLAKEKHVSEPIFHFDLPYKQMKPEGSMSSVYKKSVSFMRNVGKAEMLYEAPEDAWRYSRSTSLQSLPKPSILKTKEETTPTNPMQSNHMIKRTFSRSRDSIYKTREVARKWSGSLDEETCFLEDDQEPTKYLDQILEETLHAESEEEATEKQNMELEAKLPKIMEDEYIVEGGNELLKNVSVGVQKDWKLDEDIKNKGVQSDQSENTSVFGSSNDDKTKKEDHKTHDTHVGEEKVANAEGFLRKFTSKTNGYEGNKKESWVTFACSHIDLQE